MSKSTKSLELQKREKQMDRAEFRRVRKEILKKDKIFTVTQAQIDMMKQEAYDQAIKEVSEKAFILMLALPLEVLITEEYWMKSAKKRMPKFIDDILKLYKAYEEGSISMEEMEEDLWTFGGIRCRSQ